jgi:plastocyanin
LLTWNTPSICKANWASKSVGKHSAVKVCAVAVASLGLAGAASSRGHVKAAEQSFVVTMQITGFEPQNLTVASGDRITWVNKDLFPHSATADNKTFDSRSIAPTGAWTLVAGKPGIFAYTCIFHPTMKGIIKVQ